MAYEDYHVNADDVKLDGDPNIRRTVPPSPSGSGGGISYGTCTTAANVAEKVVTLADASGWELKQGASVAVKFSYTNAYDADVNDPVQLNVNNSGAKNIYYGDSANPTGTNPTAFGRANCVNTYVYDGAYWVWAGSCKDGNSTNYLGAKAAWDLLSSTIKAQYLTMDFIDDGGFGDISGEEVTFTSSDVVDANANSWTSVTPITSGLSLKTLFSRVSQMFKNIRYLYKQVTPTVLWSGDQGNYTGSTSNLNFALSESYKNFKILRFYIRIAPDSDNLPKRPIVRDISTEQLDWIRTQTSSYTLSMVWGYSSRDDYVDVQNSSADNNLIINLKNAKVQKIEGINV